MPADFSVVDADRKRMRRALLASTAFVALLWLVWIIDLGLEFSLINLGVYPRDPGGLPGILFSPLIHGSLGHLISNSLPTLVLGVAFLYAYPKAATVVLPVLYVGTGIFVWLFARANFHVGASGISHGMMFFLFVIGVLRRDRLAMAISMGVFFLYGSMVWGVFPTEPGISYESHFFGAVIGTLMAIVCRDWDNARPQKRYRWEDEPDDAKDPVIGDQWRGIDD